MSLGFVYGFSETGKVDDPFYQINADYPGLNKWYGLLSGPAFCFAYAVAGVFWGRAADIYNRRYLISVAAAMFSMASFLSGSVHSLMILSLMRFVLGIASSAVEPTMYSLVSDYVP